VDIREEYHSDEEAEQGKDQYANVLLLPSKSLLLRLDSPAYGPTAKGTISTT